MKPAEDIKKLIEQIEVTPSPRMDRHILSDMLAARDNASQTSPADNPPAFWRTIMQNKLTKWTVAAAILIAVLLGTHSLVLVSPTFAEVIKPLFTAETIAFDFITGNEQTDPVIHDMTQGPRIRRTISNMPDIIMIIDLEQSIMLNLDTAKKQADLFNIEGPLQEGTKSFLAFIRDTITRLQTNPEFKAQKLPRKEFDGKSLIGFTSSGPNEHITIWADPKTALPARIELQIGQTQTVLKNFAFNIPIDDSDLSIELPAGYTLQKPQMDLSNVTEQDFVESLRIWATILNRGQFPDAIDAVAFMKLVGQMEQVVAGIDMPEAELSRLGEKFGQGMMFILLYQAKGLEPWHYAGQGVKAGDAQKAVFWYRPKDSPTYRVISGDFTVKD
ncbi:MAG: hypothetical protein ABFD91_10205, partial [Anaerohalosphaeraceae bacterium]